MGVSRWSCQWNETLKLTNKHLDILKPKSPQCMINISTMHLKSKRSSRDDSFARQNNKVDRNTVTMHNINHAMNNTMVTVECHIYNGCSGTKSTATL